MQVCEKVGKSRNTVFFQWFVAPEDRKVGSLKRRVRSQPARWEMKNCTPLWREAHFRSQNVQNTTMSRTTFWKLRRSKKCTPLWREAHFEVKMNKTLPCSGPHLGSCEVEKVHAVVARSTFRSQTMWKTPHVRDHFWTFRRRFAWQAARDCAPCQKWAKREGFVAFPKTMAGVEHLFEQDLQRWIFRGRRSTRDVFIRAVRRSGRWFPEKGCTSEPEIFRFAEMILRDRCITFSWQVQYFRQVDWKNGKMHWYEAVSSALNFPFLKDVSRNSFVFDVVTFEKWGSLAELLRFWCCQL